MEKDTNKVLNKQNNKRTQNIISIAIIVVGATLSYIAFGPDTSNQEKQPASAAALVDTVTLGEENTKKAFLTKTAKLVSTQNANAVTEIPGRIRSVNFNVGIYVEKGQILASFDQSSRENSQKLALQSARHSLSLALQSLEETKKLANENEELAKNARKIAELQLEQAEELDNDDQEDIAERNLENAEDFEEQTEYQSQLSINNAELQVSQARAAAKNAEVLYENTIVRAPISGLVVNKSIEEDQFVNAGSEIAQIVATGKLQATVSLTSSQIERIRQGDEVKINISGNEHAGEIVSFSPVARGGNERFDVKIQTVEELSEESNKNADLTLTLHLEGSMNEVFFVPLDAVNIGQSKTVAFVVENEKAVLREIVTGEVVGSQIEVLNGLKSGDVLVVENSRSLQDGQKVKTL